MRWVLQGNIIREQQDRRDGRLFVAALRTTLNGGGCSSTGMQSCVLVTTFVSCQVGAYQG